MRKYLFLLILIFPLHLFSQSNNSHLDKKNGFKNLKIGMSLQDVTHLSSLEKLSHSTLTNEDSYTVKFSTYKKIEEVAILNVYVTFYKDKLVKINVDVIGDEVPRSMLSILKKEFGNPIIKGDGFSVNMKYYWYGKHITLTYEAEKEINLGKENYHRGYLVYEKKGYLEDDNGL